MSNEILYSGTGDLFLTAQLAQAEIIALTADRGSLLGIPQIMDMSDAFVAGSTAQKVPLAGLNGYDSFAAVAENTSVGNTDLTHSSITITVARQSLQRSYSGLANAVSANLTPETLAASMVGDARKRLNAMLAVAASGFTDTVGTSGADMTLDDLVDAINALELKVAAGPFLALLHPVQFSDLRTSLLGAGGAVQFNAATNEQIAIKGPGFKGSLYGVEFYTSDQVPTADAGANRAGALMGAGALAYAVRRDVLPVRGATQEVRGQVVISYDYDQDLDQHIITGKMYAGCALVEQARGVLIKTDA